MLNTKVLVLNRSYLPVHVTSVRRAFTLLYQDIARAVDEQYRTFDFASWSELAVSVEHDSIGMVSRVVRVPRVILLVAYDRVPKRRKKIESTNPKIPGKIAAMDDTQNSRKYASSGGNAA